MEEQCLAVDKEVVHIPTVCSVYLFESTSVWWDIEKCEVPMACDPLRIQDNITDALWSMGYCGCVTISAYGDTTKIPNSVQQALNSTGITLKHVPDDAKTRRELMLGDMWGWAMANRAPGNYLLISSDPPDYLSCTLDDLSSVGYNIILEYPPNEPKEERECLLRGLLDGKLPNCMAVGNPKIGDKRFAFSSSSAPSSGNQKAGGKVGRPTISSAPSTGNQKVAGKVGRPSISSAPPSRNQEVAGKVGRPSISCAPSTGNRKVAGKVGRPSISSAPPSGNQEVAGN